MSSSYLIVGELYGLMLDWLVGAGGAGTSTKVSNRY